MGAPGFPSSELILPERYRAVRHLGHGGYAEVVLVDDRAEPGIAKALKVLLPHVGRAAVASFREEFRILATLRHPGLGRVFEYGELANGRFYYTGEYVGGVELGAPPAPPMRETCLAAAAVCRALAYVHARGYVHNDVKPSNILVPEEGAASARLLDFGLAGLDRVQSRTVAGTPGYIAPERLAGNEWDARADLYSLGATLYRVLGGKRVVAIDDPARALARLRGGWRPLAALRPDLPPALVGLVERLLALDPAARPQRATEVIAGLGDAIGETLPLETPGSTTCWALASALFGRRDEIELLARTLAEAGSGRGPRLVALSGVPGIGKSRLAREIGLRAEAAGWRVAAASCAEVAGATDPLRRLASQLGVGLSDDSAGDDIAAVLFTACGDRRLLVLDHAERSADVVWHAASSLARRASDANAPVLVVVSFDADALPASAQRWLALANANGQLLRVDLRSMASIDVRAMLASLFGPGVIPEQVADAIALRSGGNPLLIEEAVREMVEVGRIRSGPLGWSVGDLDASDTASSARLDDFLRRRCAGLPPDATRALAALSVLGGRASGEAVATVAGAGCDARLGLALAVDRGLVVAPRAPDGEIAFGHEALADVALAGLEPAARSALFASAARVLTDHGADDGSLARALRGAGDAAGASEHAAAAGRRALLASDGRLAVRWLKEAAALAGEAGVGAGQLAALLRSVGDACLLAGRIADARDAYVRAYELLSPAAARDRGVVATLAILPAVLLCDFPEAARWIARAAAVTAPDDKLALARIEHAAGVAAYGDRRLGPAREHLHAALGLVDQAADEQAAVLLRARVFGTLAVLEIRFAAAGALERAREALTLAERAGSLGEILLRVMNLGAAHCYVGDLTAALDCCRRALELCERVGQVRRLPIVLANMAEYEHRLGRRDRAEPLFARATAVEITGLLEGNVQHGVALRAWRDHDAVVAEQAEGSTSAMMWENTVLLLAVSAWAAAERGDAAAARERAARAETEAARIDTPLDRAHARLARAYAVATVDDLHGGALLRDAADDLDRIGHRVDMPFVLRDAARRYARGGDAALARVCLDRARDLQRAMGCEAAEADRIGREIPAPAVARPVDPLGRRTTTPETTGGRAGEMSSHVTLADTPSVFSATGGSRLLELTLGSVELRRAFPGVVGRSPAMHRALVLLDRLADSPAPVLLTGESGTGKEVFARALHEASPRAGGPFVAASCAAIPADLFEAELLGFRQGAFTGAVRDHVGLVGQAAGGTLFLDEIGELPLALQPKLLRLLEERTLRPLGAEQAVPVDIRLCVATNRDLASEVAEGRFRADLYYRLNVVEVCLPPLRERRGDIDDLCRHLLDRHGHGAARLSKGATRLLTAYGWPGNVRELGNELERAALLAGGGAIREQHLSPKLRRASGSDRFSRGSLAERRRAFERDAIRAALREADGNRTWAARALGMTTRGLLKRLNDLGLAGRAKRPRAR